MSTIAVADAVSKSSPRVRTKTTFYVGLSLFMAALVVIGFWPSYYGQVLRGAGARPLVIHIHGAVFTGWMVLLVAQVLLAWRGRVQMHRRVGRWGIAYGFLVLTMGLVVGIAAPVMHVNAGEWTRDRAAGFFLITLGDMVLFGSLFGAAVIYRRKPEIHKRVMLAATVALLFAAVGRIPGIESVLPAFFALWLSPVLIGMLHDWRSRGRPHVAYVVSGAWLVVGASRVFVSETEAWLPVGRAILAAFT